MAQENRQADVQFEDNYAFEVLRAAFGEKVARVFLLADYHFHDSESGVTDVKRNGR